MADDRPKQRDATPATEAMDVLDDLIRSAAPRLPETQAFPYREFMARLESPGTPILVAERYELGAKLGAGGMGQVNAAHDRHLDREVAIKRLRREWSNDPNVRARIVREANLLAQLRHANVVTLYDAGEADGRFYLVMELVEGQSLGSWLSDLRAELVGQKNADIIRFWRVLQMHEQAAQGLVAIHEKGLVHRDFKPSNLLIDDDARARIIDFGVARSIIDAAQVGSRDVVTGNGQKDISPTDTSQKHTDEMRTLESASLTATGTLLGTPAYMSPEQLRAATKHDHAPVALDGRSDQFSFCVTLYQALFGHHPFLDQAELRQSAYHQIAHLDRAFDQDDLKIQRHSFVYPPVLDVLRRGMAIERDQRYPDMQSLLDALRAARRAWEGRPARRRRLVFELGLLVLSLVFTAVELLSAPVAEPVQHCERATDVLLDARAASASWRRALQADERGWSEIARRMDDWQNTLVKECIRHDYSHESVAQREARVLCVQDGARQVLVGGQVLTDLEIAQDSPLTATAALEQAERIVVHYDCDAASISTHYASFPADSAPELARRVLALELSWRRLAPRMAAEQIAAIERAFEDRGMPLVSVQPAAAEAPHAHTRLFLQALATVGRARVHRGIDVGAIERGIQLLERAESLASQKRQRYTEVQILADMSMGKRTLGDTRAARELMIQAQHIPLVNVDDTFLDLAALEHTRALPRLRRAWHRAAALVALDDKADSPTLNKHLSALRERGPADRYDQLLATQIRTERANDLASWHSLEEQWRALVGEQHPLTIRTQLGHAFGSGDRQRYQKARQAFAQATSHGHPEEAKHLYHEATLLVGEGQFDLAREQLRRLLTRPITPTLRADAMALLGAIDFYRQSYSSAMAWYLQDLTIKRELHGATDHTVAEAWANLAEALLAQSEETGSDQPSQYARNQLKSSALLASMLAHQIIPPVGTLDDGASDQAREFLRTSVDPKLCPWLNENSRDSLAAGLQRTLIGDAFTADYSRLLAAHLSAVATSGQCPHSPAVTGDLQQSSPIVDGQ